MNVMVRLLSWVKHNWALSLLVLIIGSWLIRNYFGVSISTLPTSKTIYRNSPEIDLMQSEYGGNNNPSSSYSSTIIPPSNSTNRLVISNTNLSLQVNDVAEVISQIESSANDLGGFLVNSNLSKPEGAASGNITVRVPSDKRAQAMAVFKNLAIKVVSESVSGVDVTDQYVDNDSRLEVLLKTKQKFEDIMDRATAINDLLNVQRELINLQSQIDSLKGQQKYYEQSSKLTRITVYLSTDDLSLPYSPTNQWRPAVVFKQAVRSLIGHLQGVANIVIWLVVYIPLIIPLIILIWIIKSRLNRQR